MAVSLKGSAGLMSGQGARNGRMTQKRRTRPSRPGALPLRQSLLAEAQRALHQGGMAGEGAEERVLLAGLELGHVDRGGVALAGADQLGVGDDTAVTGLLVAVGRAGLHAVGDP